MLLALVCIVGYFLIFKVPEPQDLYPLSFVSTVIFAMLGFANFKMSLTLKDKVLPILCIITAGIMLYTFIATVNNFN